MLDTIKLVHRLIIAAVATKGGVMGGLLILMIHLSERRELSPFTAALIIAIVSATITGVFTVLGAVIAIRLQKGATQDIQEIKSAVTRPEDSRTRESD